MAHRGRVRRAPSGQIARHLARAAPVGYSCEKIRMDVRTDGEQMKRYMAVLAVLALAGCGGKKPETVAVVDAGDKLNPDCYTVDLFDPFTVEAPPAEMADEAHGFLGVWKNGAWNGDWCHDLYVTRVGMDGQVEVLDAYGPLHASGLEATVFRRKGTLKDGVLSFQSRGGAVEYRRDGEYLVGKRKGSLGEFEIVMAREEGVETGEPIMLARAVP